MGRGPRRTGHQPVKKVPLPGRGTFKYAGLWDLFQDILFSEQRGSAFPRRKGASHMYEIEFVRGHVEVYLDGAFCFSADTRGEAEREIAQLTA